MCSLTRDRGSTQVLRASAAGIPRLAWLVRLAILPGLLFGDLGGL